MERFGRYELIKKIATGGMAEIYLARQAGIEGFEKLLVLKRIMPHLAESEEFVEMFLHEARVAVRLNHPNIVQIFDLGEIDGAYFIAMEYIHGEDVRRIWRQSENACNPIPVPLVCRIVMDAAAGLDYAHKRTDGSGQPLNIIHRDVSPQNILVSFEGAVKVVDFGIAKAADQATQTRSGVLKGKYSYMSPEQASGRDIDQRTDQFALGVVFYELLTFHRLFKRSNDIQTLTAVTECKISPPSEINPRVPKDLDPIVLKALAKNPDERFRDLAELQMAIDEWLLNNRQSSSSAHLSAFLRSIYSDRLSREQELGGAPLIQDQSEGSGSVSGKVARRRTSLSSIGRPSLADRTRAGRRGATSGGGQPRELVYSAPPETKGEDDEPTPVEPEPITGSSVSRLLQRMSGRKKAAIAGAIAAVLALLVAVFSLQPQGLTTTESPEPAGASARPSNTEKAVAKLAGLKVVTNPPGASVVVDGKLQESRSPVTVAGLGLGVHQVFIELKGFKDEQRSVSLQDEGAILPVTIELAPDEAATLVRLSIESEPSGAEVSIGGKQQGKTPLVVSAPGGQRIQIELSREGYREQKEDVGLGVEPEQRLRFSLERRAAPQPQATSGMADLAITCDPPATLWEGKTELGETPFHGKLAAGKHRLTLVNRELGFERTVQLTLRPAETVAKDFRLEKGEVQIIATPWADVYLRGKKLGTTPMPKLTLYEGDHQFTLVNTDLGTKKSLQVTVRSGQLEKKIVDMAAE